MVKKAVHVGVLLEVLQPVGVAVGTSSLLDPHATERDVGGFEVIGGAQGAV